MSRGKFAGALDGWSEVLSEVPDPEVVERIRKRTHSGVPCGDAKFVKKISGIIKRELKAREKGRPKKK